MEKAIRFGLEIAFLLGLPQNHIPNATSTDFGHCNGAILWAYIMPDIYKEISGTRGMPVFHPKEISGSWSGYDGALCHGRIRQLCARYEDQ